MVDSCDGSGAAYDTLQALVGRSISAPGEREILMTEYNTSVVSSSAEQTTAAGTASGLQLAHFVQRFGDRGVAVLWELFEGGGVGPDGTWGTLSEFDKPTLGLWSSLGYPPSATFWPKRTILREWLDTAGGDTVMTVDQVAGARMFAVRNHGRVSILAFNLKPDSTAVAFDPSLFPSGDILSWGTGEYNWIGTTADAQAMPDNGPSSRPIPQGWDGSAKIPPYGFLVLRGSGRTLSPIQNGHWQLNKTKVLVSDTLIASGWTVKSGTVLTGGTWSAGATSGPLVSTDGNWDGPMESWTAKIAGATIGEGSWKLRIALAAANGDTLRDSTQIQVTGKLRPVLLISDFNNKALKTTWGSNWTTYCANNTIRVSAKADTAKGLGSYYMRDSITMTQPSGITYTVYASAMFPVPAGMDTADTTRNIAGIAFDINTTHSSASGDFRVLAISSKVADYDDFMASLPNTAGSWVRDTILFDFFHQSGFGINVGPLQFGDVQKFDFRMEGVGTATLWLDNVVFLGTKGANYMVGLHPRTAHVADIALLGRSLQVGTTGTWTLRLVSADGRTLSRWTGTGPKTMALPRTAGTSWALLEGAGLRKTLSIPPLGR
jgi:hypothetical protein